MGQTLRDWYRYLERQMQVSLREDPRNGAPSAPDHAGPPASPRPRASDRRSAAERSPARGAAGGTSPPGARPAPIPDRSAEAAVLRRGSRETTEQGALPMELGPAERRRGGRRPITETREEIIRRLLDPELTLHEAAAVLNVSKATVRRYTDQGKLECRRTAGGQRRFRLSALLAFLDRQAAGRAGAEAAGDRGRPGTDEA